MNCPYIFGFVLIFIGIAVVIAIEGNALKKLAFGLRQK
jgi:hypothetical protein